MKEKCLAVSLSGSTISLEPKRIDREKIGQLADFFAELVNQGHSLIIVCGGGTRARDRITKAREIMKVEADEKLDMIGIKATHIHARYLALFLKEKGVKVQYLRTPELSDKREDIDVFTTGGSKPGHTSDLVTVDMAIALGLKTIINIGSLGSVYEKDAGGDLLQDKPISNLSWEEYLKMIPQRHAPGINVPFDRQASELAQQEGITVVILNSNPENIRNYLEGRKFVGTTISPSPVAEIIDIYK